MGRYLLKESPGSLVVRSKDTSLTHDCHRKVYHSIKNFPDEKEKENVTVTYIREKKEAIYCPSQHPSLHLPSM